MTAVDEDGNESKAYGADSLDNQTIGAPFIMEPDSYILIDETRDGNGRPGSPNDQQADDFYHSILGDFEYDDFDYKQFSEIDDRDLGAREIGLYENIIWHSDDKSSFSLGDNTELLSVFLNFSGNMILSGWDVLRPFSWMDTFEFSEISFPNRQLGIVVGRRVVEEEFIGATGHNGYPDLVWDLDKVPERWDGISNCWVMETEDAEVIYTFNSSDENSPFQGAPCGIRKLGRVSSTVTLGFPLYFMEEQGAAIFMEMAIHDIGLEVGENNDAAPCDFKLEPVYPNPFNSHTIVRYSIPVNSKVSLNVYDLSGRVVEYIVDGYKQAGTHSTHLAAENLPSGLYFLRIQISGQSLTQKVMLIR